MHTPTTLPPTSSAWILALPAAAGLLLGACSPTPEVQPGDMSVAEHRRAAAAAEEAAEEHESHYDPSEQAVRTAPVTAAHGRASYAREVYNPTIGHLDLAMDLREHAEEHREAAAELERYVEQQCGSFPPDIRRHCPLLGHVEAAVDIDDGVRIRFADNVNVAAATDHIQCHIAYARARGGRPLSGCALYVEGVEAERVDDSRSVDLTVEEDAKVDALRARARAHVPPD